MVYTECVKNIKTVSLCVREWIEIFVAEQSKLVLINVSLCVREWIEMMKIIMNSICVVTVSLCVREWIEIQKCSCNKDSVTQSPSA